MIRQAFETVDPQIEPPTFNSPVIRCRGKALLKTDSFDFSKRHISSLIVWRCRFRRQIYRRLNLRWQVQSSKRDSIHSLFAPAPHDVLQRRSCWFCGRTGAQAPSSTSSQVSRCRIEKPPPEKIWKSSDHSPSKTPGIPSAFPIRTINRVNNTIPCSISDVLSSALVFGSCISPRDLGAKFLHVSNSGYSSLVLPPHFTHLFNRSQIGPPCSRLYPGRPPTRAHGMGPNGESL